MVALRRQQTQQQTTDFAREPSNNDEMPVKPDTDAQERMIEG